MGEREREREREGNPSKWVSGSRERETKDEGRGCLLRTPSVADSS